MDIKKICKQIPIDTSADTEIDILTSAIQQLARNMATCNPAMQQQFNSVATCVWDSIYESRSSTKNVRTIFSGNGPIAMKIKEHRDLDQWVNGNFSTLNQNERYRIMTLNDLIDHFDFTPITSASVNKDLNDWCISLRSRIMSTLFTTPKPPLPSRIAVNDVQTGLYGNSDVSANLTIALHAILPPRRQSDPSNIQVVLLSPGGAPGTLWYHHPFEDLWVQSDLAHTFPGVKEALAEQFEIAFASANPIRTDFSFEEQLKSLEQYSDFIFDNEDKMPNEIFMINGELYATSNGTVPHTASYKKTDTVSSIDFPFAQYRLVFMNTKGDYPTRAMRILISHQGFDMNASKSDIKREMQESIVQTASRTLMIFVNLIRQTQIAVAPAEPAQV